MSTKHELIYFDGPGRAEAIRITLSTGNIPFTDTRLDFASFGAAKKEGKFPSGLPVLKVGDALEFTQSIAILRYAAKIAQSNNSDAASLYPTDSLKAMAVDEVLDITQDISTRCPQNPDNEIKKKLREEYMEGKCKTYCQQLEDRIAKSGGPFTTGSDLTIGDMHLAFLAIDRIETGSWDYIPKVRTGLVVVRFLNRLFLLNSDSLLHLFHL